VTNSSMTSIKQAKTPQKGEQRPKQLAPIPASPNRALSPGMPSPATSPSMIKLGGLRRLVGGGSDGFEDQILRDLRSDIIETQSFIDAQRGTPTLNPVMRQLEADVLNAQRLPLTDQLLFLLRTLHRASREVAAVCGFSPGESRGLTGPLLTGCVQLVEMEDQLAAPNDSDGEGQKAANPVDDGPFSDLALSPSFAPTDALRSANMADQRELPNSNAPAALARRASQRSFRRSSLRKSVVEADAADATVPISAVTPLSGEGAAMLRSLGVPIEAGCDLHSDEIVYKLVKAAGDLAVNKREFEHRMESAKEVARARDEQHRLEVAALRLELQESKGLLEELHREMHESRFGLAAPRCLTTINDSPMSFEVEKKYQRDLHRAELRVQQLEAQYKKLYDDGEADRTRAKQLTSEVAKHKAEIASLNRSISKLREEKAEGDSLLQGVSNTRNEEARMCAAAVEQLEARIASLRHMLSKEQRTVEIVVANLRMLMTDWCIAAKELEELRKEHAILRDEYAGYRAIYNKEQAERLEAVSRLLLRVYEERDSEEGQRAVTKQLADDANNAYKALADEFKGLTEKLRGSTEWKLLSIRAPEECKQLSVRLSVLVNEKEKREASSATPLKDRIDLYRRRAEEECARRKVMHLEEVNPPRASYFEDELRQVLHKSKCRREQDKLASSSAASAGASGAIGYRKQPMELIDEYVAAARREQLSFAAFFEQLYPSVDS
jgi:hypothetical protein